MPTNTYVALDKVTVGTATPSITFTGINQGYTDLVVVFQTGMSSAGNEPYLRFNGDSGSNYSETMMYGSGTTAYSLRNSISTAIQLARDVGLPTALESMHIVNIQNYSNSTTFKTVLARASKGSATYSQSAAYVGLWRSTAAITSLTISAGAGNLVADSVFSLYGIKSEEAAAKATGGYVTSDANYYYHTFLASGTFTPNQALTCDYLVVAGGGGASGGGTSTQNQISGGGGAGGLRSTVTATGGGGSLESTISLTSGAAYTITVGAGGAAGPTNQSSPAPLGSQGGSSSIAGTGITTVTATGGGYGATQFGSQHTGGAGGSGGGGGSGGVGGTRTASPVQGFNGGAGGVYTSPGYSGGGGGGAGVIGAAGNSTSGNGVGGNGGNGVALSAFATTTGTGISSYYAGGGGGGNYGGAGTPGTGGLGGGGNASLNSTGSSGAANTGGGGGSCASGIGGIPPASGAGGSGIVIVRYAK